MVGFPFRAKPPIWFTCLYFGLEVWKAGLLFVYSRVDQWVPLAESLSFLAIFVACAMLATVLVVARWAIERGEHHHAIRTHFFATICGALFLFSHAAYDLTFALALHDRRGEADSLYAAPKPTGVESYTLHFAEGSASIDTVVQLAALIPEWPAANDDQRAAVAKQFNSNNPAMVDDMVFDICEWKRLTTRIDTDRPSWWRVTITGHASDALAEGDGKAKNQTLSEVRTAETYAAIQREMKLRRSDVRVEWTLRAISNDDRFVARKFRDGKNHKLSVEVLLERERKFELLDYAYFMIYTITTTGYGDLMPTSPRAKFITCLANIFELLFVVIILNLAFGVYAREQRQ